MATIRFIREDLEVQCNPGENLRDLVMRENLQLYGLKGILGNCGGAGQCSTCFISVEGGNKNSLSPLTSVEEEKLKNRPENWRLACQTLIKSSAVILQAATPTAISTILMAEAYGVKQKIASKILFTTTLISIITIPLLKMFMNLFSQTT